MEKSWIIAGVVILVILVGAGFFIMNGSKTTVTVQNTPAQPEVAPSPAASIAKAGLTGDTTPIKVVDVLIQNFAFNPATITINAGDTVNWKNKDSANHQLASDSGNEIGSSVLATEGTYYHKFLTAGNYSYHCAIHSSMKGTVIVI